MQKKPVNKLKSKRKRKTIQPFGIKMNLDLKDLGKSLSKLSDEIGNKVDKTIKKVSRQVSEVLSVELKKFESRLGQIEKRLEKLSLPGKVKVRQAVKVKKVEPQPKKRGRKPSTKTCSVRGCNKPYAAKGLCKSHYNKMYKKKIETEAKTIKKVEKSKVPPKVSKPKIKKSLKEKKTCSVEGCNEKHLAKGLCRKHYWQMKGEERKKAVVKNKVAKPKRGRKPAAKKRTCSVRGCNNPHRSKGYCTKHYSQWRRGRLQG